MSIEEFKQSLSLPAPPSDFSLHKQALWFAGRGDWENAHQIIQEMNDDFSSRIHAFLHRQEGDLSNAAFWYSKSGTPIPLMTIHQEWEELFLSIHT